MQSRTLTAENPAVDSCSAADKVFTLYKFRIKFEKHVMCFLFGIRSRGTPGNGCRINTAAIFFRSLIDRGREGEFSRDA